MSVSDDLVTLNCRVTTNHPAAGGKPIIWNPKIERVHDDILLVHNVIPELDGFEGVAEAYSGLFRPSTIVSDEFKEEVSEEERTSDEYLLGGVDCPDGLLLYTLFCKTMEGQVLSSYFSIVNPHAVVHTSSGYNLLRYREGGFFREHVDVKRNHPVLGQRRLSTVIFCNDTFGGGELVFPRQGLTIEPETGLMVLFPSGFTHPHESTKITRGTKYSIVGWYF